MQHRRCLQAASAGGMVCDMLMQSAYVAQGMDSMLCGQAMAWGRVCFKGTWEG